MMLHPPGDYVSDEVRRTGQFYEIEILETVRTYINGGVVVDAGAHIGNHTTYFAEFYRCEAVHAFEPWPANQRLLLRNVARYPKVQVHQVALSDKRGQLRMRSEMNRGHSYIADSGVSVQATPLDAYQLGVSLLKIDVEGHEPQVLAGAAETIRRCRPLILIEDWTASYGELLPGYEIIAEWEHTRQTFLYRWKS